MAEVSYLSLPFILSIELSAFDTIGKIILIEHINLYFYKFFIKFTKMSNFLHYLIIIGNTIKMYVNSLYYLKIFVTKMKY
ncbi:hypothetical protein IM33_13750 [Clostridioides difficile]|nr:hypothetical protein IM33_13750 [Clostridioides difficile]